MILKNVYSAENPSAEAVNPPLHLCSSSLFQHNFPIAFSL